MNQANVFEDAEVFGDGGLCKGESVHDITDWAFIEGEKGKDVAAARFCDGVEGVGGGGCTSHGERIHAHMGICQEKNLRRSEGRISKTGDQTD
ncbi:MAG TPA: hypothetical protein VFO27_11175 [Bryobacteraceae bacterium]|nr:hypothetical protein [Bryobacteraceae bacterium]